MIRVRVPVDLHTVAVSGSSAFALATPLRVGELLSLAVREAVGARAPHDKFLRSLRTTLAGLATGRFTVHIDGRAYGDEDAIVVCAEVADVRFFMPSRRPTVRHSELA